MWTAKLGFAVVSLVAVLEHLVDLGPPSRDHRSIARLVFLVPDADSAITSTPRTKFSVEHINYSRRIEPLCPSAGCGGRADVSS
jgi:hypothetical protein